MVTKQTNYRLLFFASFVTVLFLFGYLNVYSTNYTQRTAAFQKVFLAQENQLNAFLNAQSAQLTRTGNYGINHGINHTISTKASPFFLHVYQHDSLVHWNTNLLPILRVADSHFPADGLIHLRNGWYYAKTKRIGSTVLCASFLIETNFSYQNEHLINAFARPFYLDFNAHISLNRIAGYAIRDSKNTFLFSLKSSGVQIIKEWESQLLLLLLLATCLSWIYCLFHYIKHLPIHYQWIIAAGLFILRVISLQENWFNFLRNSPAFEASLYGTDRWFPNFFEYLLNSCLIFFYIFLLNRSSGKMLELKRAKAIALTLFFFNYLLWTLLIYLNKGLIENSSIPLTINRLFSINTFSILAILSIGLLFYAFFISTKSILKLLRKVGFSTQQTVLLSLLFGAIYFSIEYFYHYKLLFSSLFPLILYTWVIFIERKRKSFQLGYGLSFLALFSLVSATNFAEFNERKERSERELYANKLANEQDIVTEVEFSELKPRIQSDKVLQHIISQAGNMKMSTFEDILEKRLFSGFWERYELTFNLFDFTGKSYIDDQISNRNLFFNLNDIIHSHSQASEIEPSIFFVKDYKDQFSYIIRLPIKAKNGTVALFFCALKSKKIPEEIGFPRLLISSKEQVLGNLLHYSIARYHNNRLVAKYGNFNYPSTTAILAKWNKTADGYANVDEYNHFILQKKASKDIIVLSSKEITWVRLLTWFSYLFGFYGIMVLPFLFQFEKMPFMRQTLNLAVKIQLVLVGLVFVCLFAFGWGSGAFIQNQYAEFSDAVIREKLTSVQLELKEKIVEDGSQAISNNGNHLEYILQTVAKIFATDINLYDPNGFLLASSRPKIFNKGLISEQINPLAYNALLAGNKSEVTHEEKIGKLSFTSAYLPFYSNKGHLLGFVNLQHFGRQKEFQDQLQGFLVAIINVFIILLAVSIILAIFISNWLTAPLRLLQENFSNLNFGKKNQRISYAKEDEIGALVKDYNKKLDELEFNAQQLAQSERESAWREMAKQVAHEIKNPLTPMKLSVQHLLRVYNPNDPNSETKLQRVATSIIEQIDSLTHIANEFSDFAKMPRLEQLPLDLIPLIENVVEVFREEKNCRFSVESPLKTAIISADKDQMIRTFNNLLKNALQAIPEDREGQITISILRIHTKIKISVTDNGIGISSEQRAKLFVPYFTTKSNGSGLGLPMVKQIIENHNGTIYLQTTKNIGSTFVIELPVIAATESPAKLRG